MATEITLRNEKHGTTAKLRTGTVSMQSFYRVRRELCPDGDSCKCSNHPLKVTSLEGFEFVDYRVDVRGVEKEVAGVLFETKVDTRHRQ